MKRAIDLKNSFVEFNVFKFGAVSHTGRFQIAEGDVNIDFENIENSSLKVKIDIGSVKTDNEQLDSHLKSVDFFESEKYPFAFFNSSKVEKIRDKEYRVTGFLKIKEVEKEISIDFVAENDNYFIGKAILQVGDWRMRYSFEENHTVELKIKLFLIN